MATKGPPSSKANYGGGQTKPPPPPSPERGWSNTASHVEQPSTSAYFGTDAQPTQAIAYSRDNLPQFTKGDHNGPRALQRKDPGDSVFSGLDDYADVFPYGTGSYVKPIPAAPQTGYGGALVLPQTPREVVAQFSGEAPARPQSSFASAFGPRRPLPPQPSSSDAWTGRPV